MNQNRDDAILRQGSSRNPASVTQPELTVLIPTFNRSEALTRTLKAFAEQASDSGSCEIVVVDDASTDNTSDVLTLFAKKLALPFRFIVLKNNGGPARARNIGLALARGGIILHVGDDIEPHPDLLQRHLQWHRRHPDERDALLGRVTFPESLNPSYFMRWLEQGGRKYFFNFAALRPHHPAPPLFFYTCNVSAKMSLMAKSGYFDESFPFASHEDLELGERLAQKGMRLF